jgi:hypothetical protein
MTLDELIAAAVARYEFRRQLRKETAAAYRVALIDHVETRDFAAAHELRIGKPQAEWSPDDVQDFKTRTLKIPRVRREFAPGETPIGLPVVCVAGGGPVTEELLFTLADNGLTAVIERRIAEPQWDVPILISALLMDGSLVATTSARGSRVAILKYLARNSPLFGFFIAADMFLHTIDDTTATKTEGIIMHIGTRERRLVRLATYSRTPAGVVFAPTKDMIPTATDEDPYADVFVSVPPPAGPPS